MRIALNIHAIGSARGGAEKYAGTLARWLSAAGHDVHVFASAVDRGELPESVHLHWVRPSCPGLLKPFRAFQFARLSERALKRDHYDLIVGFVKVWYQHVYVAVGGVHAASLEYNSRRFRSRLKRGLWWMGKKCSLKQCVFGAIARRQFHRGPVPQIIAPSRMVAEHFMHYHGVPAERVSVVYNVLEPSDRLADCDSARRRFRGRLGLNDQTVAVLFAARNYALKGLEPLLRAFAPVARDCPNARLIVCGRHEDGPYRRLCRRLGIADRVLFLGLVQEVRECFAGCDLFAMPTFYDPCSLATLEAQAAGLPVITTRQNGAAELMTDGQHGFVLESPWALDQMTDRLLRLVTDRGLRVHLGELGRRRARHFTVTAQADRLWQALTAATTISLAA